MVCLDSDIIIDFLNNKKEAVKKILQLEESEELTTTSINIFEILRGLSKFKEAEKGRAFISNLKILNFNFESAEKAAKIFEELKSIGNLVDQLDLFIASIAITNNQSLLTRNIKHFEKIPELTLEEM